MRKRCLLKCGFFYVCFGPSCSLFTLCFHVIFTLYCSCWDGNIYKTDPLMCLTAAVSRFYTIFIHLRQEVCQQGLYIHIFKFISTFTL